MWPVITTGTKIKKLRFFSDRLKGEALEWHDNYAEEQGSGFMRTGKMI